MKIITLINGRYAEDEDKAKDNKSRSIFGFKRRVGKNWHEF